MNRFATDSIAVCFCCLGILLPSPNAHGSCGKEVKSAKPKVVKVEMKGTVVGVTVKTEACGK